MIGTALNVAGILFGGIAGLARRKPLSPAKESFLKVALGAFAVFYGLRLTWQSLGGPWLHILKQLLIAVLALMLGKLTGQLCRLQAGSNRLGQYARARILAAKPGNPGRLDEGFKACAALFCAAPLGVLGAVQDGFSRYFYPLAVKGVMDGFATLGLVPLFGWGVMLAALPVLAVQGSLTLVAERIVGPWLAARGLVDPVNAVGGLLVFSVALVILGLKKVKLADYLPSLLFAPLLTWVWR